MNRTLVAAAASLLFVACSGGEDETGKRRIFSQDRGSATAATAAAFDWSRPETAFAIDGGEAARRLGAYDYTAAVVWSVGREGDPPRQVAIAERHSVRHAASGEFEVVAELDPGEGEHARSGRRLVYVDRTTYARSLYAPFGEFRERPTDRGRDAARHRDESFGLAADVMRLLGAAVRLEPQGDATVLGRRAKRFAIRFVEGAPAAPAPTIPLGRSTDADTQARLRFLEGRAPRSARGELLADAETGVPLQVHLDATFGVAEDPAVRASVELRSGIRELGAKVAAIRAPKGALPDERKPPGVSDALEAAGLKKREAGPDDGASDPAPPDEG